MEGFKTLFANDHEKPALATFKRNHNEALVSDEDIQTLDPQKLRQDLRLKPGQLDVLIGGPPCQGFSTYGQRRKGDDRNRLFEHYLRFVSAFKPKTIVLENVIGILSMQGGAIVQEILEGFQGEGYTAEVFTLDATEFGVPQNRRRVFICGALEGAKVSAPRPTHEQSPELDESANLFGHRNRLARTPTVRDAIADLPKAALAPRDAHVTLDYPDGDALSEFAKWAREGASELTHHSAKRMLGIRRVRLALLRPGDYGTKLRQRLGSDGLDESLIEELFNGHESMRDINECRKQDRDKENQLRGLLSQGHVTVEQLFELVGAGGFANKYRRLEWDKPSHTIVAHMARDCSDFVHPELDRFGTVREAARLQTFPDRYYFESSQFQQFRQIGNAVPPLLGAALARSVKEILPFPGSRRQVVSNL